MRLLCSVVLSFSNSLLSYPHTVPSCLRLVYFYKHSFSSYPFLLLLIGTMNDKPALFDD